MNLQFENPEILFILWLVPAVGSWWYAANRRRQTALEKFMSYDMRKKLCPSVNSARFGWQSALMLAGCFLVLVSAARPKWGMKEELVYSRGRDLMIALDVSRSMLANEVHPNRLERAKTDILDLVRELKGDRAGLLAFRHKAVLLCPLTTDYAYLKYALDAVDIGSAPRGETDIGDAIIKALDSFENDNAAHKAIILISDGEDLSDRAIDAANTAAERNIPIFTIGLGSRQGSRIPTQDKSNPYSMYKGQAVITKLNHETLYQIAKITGGSYVPVETASMTSTTLGTLYRNHLRNILAQDLEESLQRRHIERYQLFLLPGILLILAGTFLSRGRLCSSTKTESSSGLYTALPLKDLTPPKRPLKHVGIIFAALCFSAITANALQTPEDLTANAADKTNTVTEPGLSGDTNTFALPPGREGARIAQKLYMTGKYDESAEAYLRAAHGSTYKSQLDFRHNAAVALFKAGRYREASEIFSELNSSFNENKQSASSSMALGASLYRTAESLTGKSDATNATERVNFLKHAGEAFKNAARTDEDNESTRENLAVVLKALPEAETQAKFLELMNRYQQTPPAELAMEMLLAQTDINKNMAHAFTNNSPSQIKQLEDLALKQKATADLWIPLKPKLLTGLQQQDQQQIANLDQAMEATRENMINSANRLRDIEPEAYRDAKLSQSVIYRIWKDIAPYPMILTQDIRLQSNSMNIALSDSDTIKMEQEESIDLTRIFIQRFSEAVPETPPDTNTSTPDNQDSNNSISSSPTNAITPELRAKILQLADQAVYAQELASGLLKGNNIAGALPHQQSAYTILKEIENLLPKNQDQQQKQQSQDNQNQEQENQEEEEQNKEQDIQEQAADKKDAKPEPEKQDEEKDSTPRDVKELLKKALQREQEHESQKRMENMQMPMLPSERDW